MNEQLQNPLMNPADDVGEQSPNPFHSLSKRGRRLLLHAIQHLEHKHLRIPRREPCKLCNGTGQTYHVGLFKLRKGEHATPLPQVCEACKGYGYHLLTNCADENDLTAARLLRYAMEPTFGLDALGDSLLPVEFDEDDALADMDAIEQEINNYAKAQKAAAKPSRRILRRSRRNSRRAAVRRRRNRNRRG